MKLKVRKTNFIIHRAPFSSPHPNLFILNDRIQKTWISKTNGCRIIVGPYLTWETPSKHIIQRTNTGPALQMFLTYACNISVLRSLYSLILTHFKYCSHVWISATDCLTGYSTEYCCPTELLTWAIDVLFAFCHFSLGSTIM